MSEAFEKLGLFYLGRRVDPDTRRVTETPVLYDANDLVTHGAIIGMTGSGKTGLGIALLEEAAMDGVPVLAVDPKGDLGNLLLTFPQLTAASLAPWVSPEDARAKGVGEAEWAAGEAARWKQGLADWGQSEERIARLRAAADFAIYTPGSTAGTPISILKSFAPPDAAVLKDGELMGERVGTATTSLLTLAGVEADPMRSREHVLISALLHDAWQNGTTLDIPSLIAAVQKPPMSKVGVMDLESFFPAADRFELAMRLNHLVAAPGFAAWLHGDALDIGRLLYSANGKPRVSVISIAHLDDRERMFFVSLLLNEVVGWMRVQRGTSSLRTIVYFDEIFGFLPPVANPPSKPPLMTLLKQARAFGVGLVVATQNPVDLDYKALSNTGTWFLGRLQTERDKSRLLDGLEGVAANAFDRSTVDGMLSKLEKRVFLMHNVHEDGPTLFQTRWTMAYLRGPLGREEIARLSAETRDAKVLVAPAASEHRTAPPAPVAAVAPEHRTVPVAPSAPSVPSAPVLDPAIQQFFAPGDGRIYTPSLLGALRVSYSDSRLDIDEVRDVVLTTPISDGAVPVDWENASPAPFALNDLKSRPDKSLPFASLPTAAADKKKHAQWAKDLARWAAQSQSVELLRSARTKLTSRVDEDERAFRIRLQADAREARDAAVAKVRQKYATKLATAEDRLRRAEGAVQREQEQASESKVQAGVSIAATIAGALLGRKAVSLTTLGRATTAARGMGRIGREAQDVVRAQANLGALREARDAIAADLERDMQQVAGSFDASTETFERVLLKPKRGSVSVQLVALLWTPQA
jgi:uncharacterized protein DUF87